MAGTSIRATINSILLLVGSTWLPALAAARAHAQLPLLQTQEDVRIGSETDPLYAVTPTPFVALDAAGRIYVADMQAGFIRVYDFDGKHVRNIGTRGAGPGEFTRLAAIGSDSARVWGLDVRSLRTVVFDTSGAVLETVGARVPITVPGSSFGLVWGLSGDSAFIVEPSYGGEAWRPATGERLEPVLLTSREGAVIDTLGHRSPAPVVEITDVDPSVRISAPLTRRRLVSYGSGPVFVEAGWSHDGDAGEGRVSVRAGINGGGTVFETSWQYAPQPVPAAYRDSVHRSIANSVAARFPSAAAALSAVRKDVPLPATFPGVSRLHVGFDGTVWLLEGNPAEGVWTVLSVEGRRIAHVYVPPAIDVVAVNQAHIWGFETGPDLEPHLVRRRVVQPGDPSR